MAEGGEPLVAVIFRIVYTTLIVIVLFFVQLIQFVKSPGAYLKNKRRNIPAALATPDCGKHGFLYTRRLRYHYVANGEKGKPLMLFVHGFPEFWYTWRYQLKEFGKDYYAVAFDNRGFSDSSRPNHVDDYHVLELIEDVREMIEGLGYQKCILVSHDWGGYIAWHFAHFHPECIDKLIVMNAPHPRIFKHYMETHFTQVLKSWYIFFYQLPYLPEFTDAVNDYGFLDEIIQRPIDADPKTKGKFTEEDMECYKYTFSRPGCLTSSINYYRRNVFVPPLELKYDRVTSPTLVIWGLKDLALDKGLNDGLPKYVDKVMVKYVDDATHWVNQQYPDEVNKIMREYLQS